MTVIVQDQGSVRVLTLSRPSKKNALTLDMYAGLADGISSAEADPKIRAIVILAEGNDFCAGNDLQDFMTLKSFDGTPLERFLYTLEAAKKPVIAGVQGFAVGIGSTMLLHCDMVLAAPSAKFQFAFINMALVPEAGSSLLLPRLVGHQRAAELVMLGEVFGPEQALQFGMINRMVDAQDLSSETLALAQKLAEKPAQALRWAKQLLKQEPEPLTDRIKREVVLFESCLRSPELKESIGAFFEKRAPDYKQFD